jgi:TolA-binding protein
MSALDDFKKDILKQLANMNLNIAEIRGFQLPNNHTSRVDALRDQVDKMVGQIADLSAKINLILQDKKMIDVYTDQEIQGLYMDSKCQLKDVADKFCVSVPQASNYVKGDIADLKIRHDLGRYLKIKRIENER